ncbi:putative phage holin [Nocardia sp. NPDC004260]
MSGRTNLAILAVAFLINVTLLVTLPIQDAVNVLIVTVAVKSTLLTLVYGFTSGWRFGPLGKSVILLVSSIAFVTIQGSVSIFTDANYPGRDQIREVLWTYVALSMLWLLLTIYREQQEGEQMGKGASE